MKYLVLFYDVEEQHDIFLGVFDDLDKAKAEVDRGFRNYQNRNWEFIDEMWTRAVGHWEEIQILEISHNELDSERVKWLSN